MGSVFCYTMVYMVEENTKKAMQRRLGAHLSIAGGFDKAVKEIVEMGGNCLQIFSSSPRAWVNAEVEGVAVREFVETKNDLKVSPIYFHALYLVNLADNGATGEKSVANLVNELKLAPKMRVKGTIVHLGSYKRGHKTDPQEVLPLIKADSGLHSKYKTLLKNTQKILNNTPQETLFIIENAGTRKIGASVDEVAQIVEDLGNSRVRVCLDTCHLHAAGYDLSSRGKLEKFLGEFDEKIGLERLECWHLNDSKDKLGSLRDRHENIGEGQVGIKVFELLLNHPQLKNLPFIIETPGFAGRGPGQQNLERLKGLIT